MNMKSLKTQFIGAIAMVLVAAIAMGSSTYAWFAINSKVTATGMAVKTTVSDNLFIADLNQAGGTKLAANFNKIPKEDAFVTSVVLTAPAAATLLEPTSTVNGNNFFYNLTTNTNASGARASTLINYKAYDGSNDIDDGYDTDFESNYLASGAVGYVDYPFALKAVNGSGSTKYINLKNLSLTYGDNTDTISKAFRIALFFEPVVGTTGTVSDGTNYSVSADVPADGDNLNSIKSMNGATYFTPVKAVSAVDTLADVTGSGNPKLNNATSIAIDGGKTMYYKVIVRVWLEGEDNTCNNTTFMSLKDNWSIDLEFQMENAAPTTTADVNAASYIAHDGNAKTPIKGTSAASAAYTIDGVDYFKLGDTAYYLTAASTAYTGAVGQSVYTISDSRFVTDVTNFVTLDTTPDP